MESFGRSRHLLLTLVISILMFNYVTTEGPDQMGREFVLGFWNVLDGSKDQTGVHMPPTLYISTIINQQVSVSITTPLLSFSEEGYFQTTVVISRGTNAKVELPVTIRTDPAGNVYDKTVLIQATDEVAIQAMNMEDYNGDGFTAYPTDALGEVYYLVTASNFGAFLIMATTPGVTTNVDITVEGDALLYRRIYRKGQVLNVQLQQYQVFSFVDQTGNGGDFSATKIHADHPVVVITGNYLASVGTNNGGTVDTIMSQSLPLTNWGNTYVLSPTPHRTVGEVYKIVSFADATQVELSGTTTFTLQKDAMREIEFNQGHEFKILKSSNPVLVYKMSPSLDYDPENGDKGDPALSYMPALPQWTNQYVFSTMDGHPSDHGDYNPLTYYMTIVIATDHKDGLRWNGKALSDSLVWRSLPIDPVNLDMIGIHIELSSGVHDLYHTDPLVTFLVHTVGLGDFLSYTALAGSRAAIINNPACENTIPVEADIVDNDCDGLVDEESANGIDDDNDGLIDEDITYKLRIDGNWGEWSEICYTETCKFRRQRSCDNPEPEGFGAPCEGADYEDTDVDCPNCGGGGPGLITSKPDPPDTTIFTTQSTQGTGAVITTTGHQDTRTDTDTTLDSLTEAASQAPTSLPSTESDITSMNIMTTGKIISSTELPTTSIITKSITGEVVMPSTKSLTTNTKISAGADHVSTTAVDTSTYNQISLTEAKMSTQDLQTMTIEITTTVNKETSNNEASPSTSENSVATTSNSPTDQPNKVTTQMYTTLNNHDAISEISTVASGSMISLMDQTTETSSSMAKTSSTAESTSQVTIMETSMDEVQTNSISDESTLSSFRNTLKNDEYRATKDTDEGSNLGVSVGVPLGLLSLAAVSALAIFAVARMKRKRDKENKIADSTTSLQRGTNSETSSIDHDLTAVEI